MEHNVSQHQRNKSKKPIVFIASVLGFFVLCLGGLVYMMLSSDKGPQRSDNKPQMVSLLAPPPQPKLKEQPPEPQETKQEKVQQQVTDLGPNTPDKPVDNTPPAKDLGVDAEGSGSGDGFGLQGRKGGRGLISGGGGGSLYGWYTSRISSDLQRMVNELLRQEGGLPEGKWQTIVSVELDLNGGIKKFSIIGSSGNQKMDAAVTKALKTAQPSELPPPGMPRVLKMSFTI